MVFQTEKQLKEFGDKLPDEKKKAIQDAADALKLAKDNKDFAAVDKCLEELNKSWQAASNEMQQAQAASASSNKNSESTQSNSDNSGDTDVTDVDFEEVKDDK